MRALLALSVMCTLGCGSDGGSETDDAARIDAGGGPSDSGSPTAGNDDAGARLDAMPREDGSDLATDGADVSGDALSPSPACSDALPYASELVSFSPGDGAGHGQDNLPDVVLGPPKGGGPTAGSLHVVSLGGGGEIVVGFGDRTIVDGPGADFIVFENAFWVGGDPENPFKELGLVEVSADGETWHAFDCDPSAAGVWPGCAGWSPRQTFDPCTVVPLVPETAGGDAFDLAEIGVTEAKYVRITDLGGGGGPPSVGFDLDAVGAVHIR